MARKHMGQGFKALALRIGESHYTGWLVALAFFALFVRFGQVMFESSVEPYTFHSVEVLTPKIKLGEPLILRYHLRRNRVCPTMIAQFFVDPSNGQAVYRDIIPGGYTTLGERMTTVSIRLPFVASPGQYVYRSVMNSDCGMTSFSQLIPDASFEVVLP